jgi:predicted nuclease of restriction endonuclease-like (RecB) superfamily
MKKKIKDEGSKELSILSSDDKPLSPKEYASTLAGLKKQIQECQIRAITSVNKELINLYWTIGKIIVEKQESSGWGSKFIEKLAKDLQSEFPGIEGFSRANVFRMKAFFIAYEKVAQPARQIDRLPIFDIPWGFDSAR